MDKSTVVFRDTIVRGGKRHFKYTYKNGRTVSQKTHKEIAKFYIPHSWDDVEIYLGHHKLVATGVLKGIVRYQYHKDFTELQSKNKYTRLKKFTKHLDNIIKDIHKKIHGKCSGEERVIVTALWLLLKCYMRVGNDRYLKENNTYGLLTLKRNHLTLTKKKLTLDFIGKKKVRNKYAVDIDSNSLHRWIKYLYDNAKPFVFHYRGRRVTPSDLNAYIQANYGPFTAKDFRTFGANIEILKAIEQIDYNNLETKRDKQKALKTAIETCAGKLNNTVAVCKSNYICNTILDEFMKDPKKLIIRIRRSKSKKGILQSLLK